MGEDGEVCVVEWMQRFQVPLYLAAIGLGALGGLMVPTAAEATAHLIVPALGALLYVTFLGVPFVRMGAAFRDGRFLTAIVAVNVVAVVVAYGLSRFVAHDAAVLMGVLLVLLTPCVDYVIVFSGLAGGDRARLLAATPILMVGQLIALPPLLLLMAGPEHSARVEVGPFVEAFVFVVMVPLALAALTHVAGATRPGQVMVRVGDAAMVPLMMLALAVVVASQLPAVAGRWGSLAALVPLYLAFAVVMVGVGLLVGRMMQLPVPARRSVVFSGVTRNSLVVLPLALALPAGFGLAPLAVVTQTLVELVVMVILVRVVPRLVPGVAHGEDTLR